MSCKRSQPLVSPPVVGGNIVNKQLLCCGVFGLLLGKADVQQCGDELHKPLSPGSPIYVKEARNKLCVGFIICRGPNPGGGLGRL